MSEPIDIPVDMYESTTEFVVVMPLGGVKKTSVALELDGTSLIISGTREKIAIKDVLMPQREDCFWGSFTKTIQIPPNSYFNKIHSELTPENILLITIPKVIVPEKITVHIK